MNKSSTIIFVIAIIGLFISADGIIYTLTAPLTTALVTLQHIYTLRWNGNNTELTAIYAAGNVTISVTHGENFAVNGSTTLYDSNNKFVARLP